MVEVTKDEFYKRIDPFDVQQQAIGKCELGVALFPYTLLFKTRRSEGGFSTDQVIGQIEEYGFGLRPKYFLNFA